MNRVMNRIKHQLLAIVFLLSTSITFAQIPNGYYDAAQGLSGYTLKTSLHNIIENGHIDRGYGALYSAYAVGDTDPNDGYVWDMYSENPNGTDPYNYTHGSNKCGNYQSEGDCYNREHLFPQGIFSSLSPMKSDYHHVVPSDGKVNGQRSNYAFGEVSSPTWTSLNGSKRGPNTTPGYSGTVFEPIDEYKGDIARSMLYFATRYEDRVSNWSHAMINGSSDQVYTDWFLQTLLTWHNNDPVSTKETVRNDAGYDHQGNRNPFIDHPEWVSQIWSSSNNPTSIANITLSPLDPSTTQTVSVSAVITDADGIKTTNLYWGTSSATITNIINMTNTTGDNYSTATDIPVQVNSNVVYYKIVAKDSNDIISSSIIDNYGTIPVGTDLINEDFQTATDQQDINIDGWTTYNETGSKNWIGRTYDQSNFYTQFSSYGTGEQNTAWLISPKVNLDNSVNEIFSFDINVGYWKHDGLTVLTSQDYDGSDVSSATWVDITSDFSIPSEPADGYGIFATSGNYNFNDYNGDVNIAFKYTGSEPDGNTTTYQIDNVLLAGEVPTSIINNDTKIKAEVFPNPFSENLSIKLEGNMLLNVRIHNNIGQLVFEKQINHNNISTIDIKSLEKGIYFLQLQNGNENITRKIIKQ